jgi:hypothetical protein
VRRFAVTIISAGIMALGFPIATDAATQHVQASPDSTVCEAGYRLIVNYVAGNLGIQANGVGEPVTLNAPDTGSCFETKYPFYFATSSGTFKGYEYQNESGHCLYANGSTLEITSACTDNNLQESFFGAFYGDDGPGWVWYNAYDYNGLDFNRVDARECDEGDQVTVDSDEICYLWNFPS